LYLTPPHELSPFPEDVFHRPERASPCKVVRVEPVEMVSDEVSAEFGSDPHERMCKEEKWRPRLAFGALDENNALLVGMP
jgi:hypothetical protein